MHSKAARKPLVAIILSILKCMFYSRTIGPSPKGGLGAEPVRPPMNPPLACVRVARRVVVRRRDGLAALVVPVPGVAVAPLLARARRPDRLHSRRRRSRDPRRRAAASDVTAAAAAIGGGGEVAALFAGRRRPASVVTSLVVRLRRARLRLSRLVRAL